MIKLTYTYNVTATEEAVETFIKTIRAYSPETADAFKLSVDEHVPAEIGSDERSYAMTFGIEIKPSMLEKFSKLIIGLQPMMELLSGGLFDDQDIELFKSAGPGGKEATEVRTPVFMSRRDLNKSQQEVEPKKEGKFRRSPASPSAKDTKETPKTTKPRRSTRSKVANKTTKETPKATRH